MLWYIKEAVENILLGWPRESRGIHGSAATSKALLKMSAKLPSYCCGKSGHYQLIASTKLSNVKS